MNLGKALAMTAVTGMIAGLAACGGEQKADPNTPSTSAAPPTDKNCCKGKNDCKGKGMMKMSEKDCTAKGGTAAADDAGEKK